MKTSIPQSRPLSPEEADAFGEALDALRRAVLADLGQRDVDHIRRVIRACRYSEAGGRALLHFGVDPISFILGAGLLGLSKILDNMEIGHNVMHGQYDWTRDPELRGAEFEWDIACDGDDWREYHNFEHHTFTNVLGKDRDIGYNLVRVTEAQPWRPICLVQALGAAVMAANFQWGVATHNLHVEETLQGKQPVRRLLQRARPFLRKARRQLLKDYALFPALAGLNAPRVAAGNLLANMSRNLWTFAVIFCGHFPEGARFYTAEEAEGETRGQWYARQVNGSVNIEGGRLFHILTGHLSHQIEHHLFPDIPASRYPEMAREVQRLCGEFGQAYNTGTLTRQLGSVVAQIIKRSFPEIRRPEAGAAPA